MTSDSGRYPGAPHSHGAGLAGTQEANLREEGRATGDRERSQRRPRAQRVVPEWALTREVPHCPCICPCPFSSLPGSPGSLARVADPLPGTGALNLCWRAGRWSSTWGLDLALGGLGLSWGWVCGHLPGRGLCSEV